MALLPPVIARRHLLCTPAGQDEREVVVTIRAPVPEGARWVCEAGLENLYRDVAQARGVDSLQALQLALDLVRRTLGEVVEAGGRLRWKDGSGDVTPEDLMR
jgi:hypothetical protein